jgi:hypothetical protein
MLKNMRITQFLLVYCLFSSIPGYGWEYEQQIIIEGVLRRAEKRCITRDSDGKEKVKIEKSIVLVTDEPLVLSRSVMMGSQQIAVAKTSYPHIEIYLAEEFRSLIGKRVKCKGFFKRSEDLFADDIVLDVDTALDCEKPAQLLKTVFYEPQEVELIGMLHKTVYPGPPEYMSVEMGDRPEEVFILTLKEPIDVEAPKDDDFNESEKGVHQLQVVFGDSIPNPDQLKEAISLRGNLYHSHTAHHRRRVLMSVNNWKNITK